MENSARDSEKNAYLQDQCDEFMTDLILQLLSHRPTNTLQFIHDYTGKLMRNEHVSKPYLTQELRKSIPNFSWPDDARKSVNKSFQQDLSINNVNSQINTEIRATNIAISNRHNANLAISNRNNTNVATSNAYNTFTSNRHNDASSITCSNNIENLSVDNLDGSESGRESSIMKHKNEVERVKSLRHITDKLQASDAETMRNFFNLNHIHGKNYSTTSDLNWVEQQGNGKTNFTRVARYPEGTEWDAPITTLNDEPNKSEGWYYSKTTQKEEDKEVLSKIIKPDQSQMEKIHCHRCEFSWAHINKARSYSQNKFILKRMPDFDIFMDVTYKPVDIHSFNFESHENILTKISEKTQANFASHNKKNLVFFLRFTGKYKERQKAFFKEEKGDFLINRPYCLRCVKDICVEKLCPLNFDKLVKIIHETKHYHVMLRNDFTDENNSVLRVLPVEK